MCVFILNLRPRPCFGTCSKVTLAFDVGNGYRVKYESDFSFQFQSWPKNQGSNLSGILHFT